MSVLKSIAAWLDPEAGEAREESKAALLNAQDAINEMSTRIEELSKANDNLIQHATQAGLKANARGDMLKKAVTELILARPYVIDQLDDIDTKLSTVSQKSKRRVVLEATKAAIEADVSRINVIISDTQGML